MHNPKHLKQTSPIARISISKLWKYFFLRLSHYRPARCRCSVLLSSCHALFTYYTCLFIIIIFCLNKGWPTRWHLLHYLLLNMFQTLIRPSSGACGYLLRCVGWLEACWCYVTGLYVGDVVSECRLNRYCTRITHHQQPIPLHNTSTPQVSLHNATSSRKLLKMDVLKSETCWAVDNKASVI